jgi:hypothetical protein
MSCMLGATSFMQQFRPNLRGADALRERLRPSPKALAQRGPPPASPLAAVPANESSRTMAVPLGPCPGVDSPLGSAAAPGEPSLPSSPLLAAGSCPFGAAAAAAVEGERAPYSRCRFVSEGLAPLCSDGSCPRRTVPDDRPPVDVRAAARPRMVLDSLHIKHAI